jgi:hypothetical protein
MSGFHESQFQVIPITDGKIMPQWLRGMTTGLERWYGGHDLHFITCSCYQRRPQLDSREHRDLFLRVLARRPAKVSLCRNRLRGDAPAFPPSDEPSRKWEILPW